MRYEGKIIGSNPLWISALLSGTFLILCATGGEDVSWGFLGFEVLFPFYTAVAIGEWCKTRTDQMFEVISAQSTSLFLWVVRRFVLLYLMIGVFAVAGMLGTAAITKRANMGAMFFAFLATSFFLSSMCICLSLLSSIPHMPTMAVGVLWLFSIMSMSLLRFEPVQYLYLFAGFAGIANPVWLANKLLLLFIAAVLWVGVFFICKKRLWAG